MPKNKETLTIVVNGTPTDVEANENAPIRTVIPIASPEQVVGDELQ